MTKTTAMRHLSYILPLVLLLSSCTEQGTWSQRFRDRDAVDLDYTYEIRVAPQHVLVFGPQVLRVFDRQSGAPKWDIGFHSYFDTDTAGNTYVFHGEKLLALDPEGRHRWAYPLPDGASGRGIALSHGQVHALVDNSLLRVNSQNGMAAAKPVALPGLPPLEFTDLHFYSIQRTLVAGAYWLSFSDDSLWQHRISDGVLVRDTFCGTSISDVLVVDQQILVAHDFGRTFTCPLDPTSARPGRHNSTFILRLAPDPFQPDICYSLMRREAQCLPATSDPTWSQFLEPELYPNSLTAVRPLVSKDRVLFGSRGASHLLELDKRSGKILRQIDLDGELESSLAEADGRLYYVADGVLHADRL